MDNTSYGNSYANQYYGIQQPQPQPQNRQQYGQAGNPYANQPMTQTMQIPMSIPAKISDFVQGELGATIFAINYCNQEAFMLDMDNEDIVYRKHRDATGKMSPITKWKLVPLEEEKPEQINLTDYVKTEEVKKMINDNVIDLITETVQEAVQNEVEKRFSQLASKSSTKKGSDE